MARAQAFVFDAYGTLFDVHSVVAALRAVTADAEAVSLQWRAKQLEAAIRYHKDTARAGDHESQNLLRGMNVLGVLCGEIFAQR